MRLARVGCQRCFIRGGVNSTTAPTAPGHHATAAEQAPPPPRTGATRHPRFPFLEAEDKKNVLQVCWRGGALLGPAVGCMTDVVAGPGPVFPGRCCSDPIVLVLCIKQSTLHPAQVNADVAGQHLLSMCM